MILWNVPAPGSHAAYVKGCTCSMIRNRYGQGYHVTANGEAMYMIMEGCPLHDATNTTAIAEPVS